MEKITIDTYDSGGNYVSARTSWIYAALVKNSILRRLGGTNQDVAYVKEGGWTSDTFGAGGIIRPTSVPNAEYIIVAPEGFEVDLRSRITTATGTTLEDCTIQQFLDALEAQCDATPVTQWDTFSQNATSQSNRDLLNGAFNSETTATITTADGDVYPATLSQMTTQGNMSVFFDWIESCLPPQVLSLQTARIIDNGNPDRLIFQIHVEGATGTYASFYGTTCDVKLDIRL